MKCSKVRVIASQCLVVLFALLTTSTTQGRSSHRTESRRDGLFESLREVELDREMMRELEQDLPALHPRNGDLMENILADYEEIVRDSEELQRRKSARSWERLHAIRKRHNEAGRRLAHETITEQEETKIRRELAANIHHHNIAEKTRRKRFEVELKEAQNSSLCNYTVTEIRDTSEDRSRIPKHLVDVKCNHAGLKCREPGAHYCLQTYGKVEVSYSNGTTEVLKILTGCVCALREYARLEQFRPRIIDDWEEERR
ncbi:uncharacterized protein [Venturia canescens]|uniref:uncharacterized protein n=1 Tax=Venturia canescens TaxID=32260 RepID=UPI001C9C241B|nr:uncharacterized protein LOC122409910 [Venturia canescens]